MKGTHLKKNESLSMRLPSTDKERLKEQAAKKLRDVSELAWLLVRDGVSRLERGEPVPDYVAHR